MAKGAFEIQMDYRMAVQQAESLREIARELQNLGNQNMQDCMAEISGNWKGNNSNEYISKCSLLKGNVIKTADKLERIANTIQRIAKNTYDAEMESLRLALTRVY